MTNSNLQEVAKIPFQCFLPLLAGVAERILAPLFLPLPLRPLPCPLHLPFLVELLELCDGLVLGLACDGRVTRLRNPMIFF